MKLGEALETATNILTGDRNGDYGNPAAMWLKISNTFMAATGIDLSPEDCVKLMICVKLVRESYHHKTDNLVDLAAYADILAYLHSRRAQQP